MNIKIFNVRDLREEFKSFFEHLEGCNYIIDYDIITFNFCQSIEFSLQQLSQIVTTIDPQGEPVDGTLAQVSFMEVKKSVTNGLSYISRGGGIHVSPDKVFVTKRVDTFWNIIQNNFILPPSICYRHEAYPRSYFDFGVMWDFCFILLNQHQQGIIIYAGAAD